jgi:hypothetical protein
MESIRIWLNGPRSYKAGAKLYQEYGTDELLKRLFSEGESTFKKEKLVSVFKEMIRGKVGSVSKIGTTVQKKATSVQKAGTPPAGGHQPSHQAVLVKQPHKNPGTGWSTEMDEVEAALFNEWKPVFSERNDLCSRVGEIARQGEKDPAKEKEAGIMALRILDLDDQCDRFYNKRDYYLKNKALPEEKPYGEPCIDPKLIPLKLENAMKYVRHYRAKLEKDPGNENYKKQVDKHEWFVQHYKKELNKS